ncbi:SixA phosphatase family protein [Erythrobacter sanguineus]|uniref:Phosphohistidine phosphatase n=1 Tax=Erythrobacter sanguineus TaxID=198312 RepID=A0A1M7RRJ3_9SPHN|nr:histidine phosphatase family protein [Erythrobacter sanguineus]MCR9180040.1 histidine phosphatase family protein [Erythrobacteraceae bacterium]SHN48688.1 phosphohistidine phosphatase [Erythrobacter sanguineus]
MKILGLLRHAKSDWDDTSQRDFDRGLNARGRKGARLIGKHIRAHGIAWDKLIASPAVRVKLTLEAALPEMSPEFDQKLYLASYDTIIETIEAHAESGAEEADAILISGHNPGLQDVLLELVAPGKENALFKEAVVKFPTAAYAVLECDIEHWSQLKRYCAEMVHFARPRDLDPELGPEN